MAIIKVAIVDDDIYIRQLLQGFLNSFSQIEIVASVDNGKQLLEVINQDPITAVFIDIKMPDMDGLSCAVKIKETHPDLVIVFVSAHPEYAAETYQLDAIDFIVKPFSQDSIAKTIGKIEKFLSLRNQAALEKNDDRLCFKNGHELYFIKQEDILFIEKELRKTVIHTSHGKYITKEILNKLEQKLNQSFFRCHKSFIINLNKIERVSPIADRIYEVNFYQYTPSVTIGRKKYEELCGIMFKNT